MFPFPSIALRPSLPSAINQQSRACRRADSDIVYLHVVMPFYPSDLSRHEPHRICPRNAAWRRNCKAPHLTHCSTTRARVAGMAEASARTIKSASPFRTQ
jgi:hypothetical protein